MLARAAAELERRGLLGIDLQVMDAESLSFADCSFDLVFCAFAFSSFPDKPQAIREFVRVLRPGGRVCILGTSRGSTMPLTHSDEELPPDDPIYGHTYFVFRNSPTPSTDTSSGTESPEGSPRASPTSSRSRARSRRPSQIRRPHKRERTNMASALSAPRKAPDAILIELLERLAGATELAEVNIAAGIALNEMLGVDTD